MTTRSIFYEESMHGTEQHAGHCCLWRVLRMTRRSTCHPERLKEKGFENSIRGFGVSFSFFSKTLSAPRRRRVGLP